MGKAKYFIVQFDAMFDSIKSNEVNAIALVKMQSPIITNKTVLNCPVVIGWCVVLKLAITLILAQVTKFLQNIKIYLQVALCVVCKNF